MKLPRSLDGGPLPMIVLALLYMGLAYLGASTPGVTGGVILAGGLVCLVAALGIMCRGDGDTP